MSEPLLSIRNLTVDFAVRMGGRRSTMRAVDDVSLDLPPGITFGLVGESGSGKSTLARAALRLIKPTAGATIIDGQDLSRLSGRALRAVRRDAAMVFQNPIAALNPRMDVEALVGEPLRLAGMTAREVTAEVTGLLDQVGLPRTYLRRLPHQLSGGQCQRIGIARALSTRPRLLVLDEPTSALDVSVQAQILNLLQDLRDEHGLTYLLISHDLDVVYHMSERIAVMYRGRLVERGHADDVFGRGAHPYTELLIQAIPGQGRASLIASGSDLDPTHAAVAVRQGCAFAPRCALRQHVPDEQCRVAVPALSPISQEHEVACHVVARSAQGIGSLT